MKQLNILYVYGFNSSENSSTYKTIKNELKGNKNIKVFCFNYPQQNPFKSVNFLNDKIKENNIDLVIGSSLGGFITLNLNAKYRIVCNPALEAGDDIKPLGAESEMIKLYNQLKNEGIWKNKPNKNILTYGLFGTNDELFKHKDIFDNVYKKSSKYVDTKHHYNEKNVRDYIIPEVNKIYDEK